MTFLLRLMTFITHRVVLLCIVCALGFFAFFAGMNLSNIYIVLKDGMQTRAGVILHRAAAAELTKFFTLDYIAADSIYRDKSYEYYTIRGFEHQMNVERMWCWPWATSASATITEYILSIDGELPVERQSEEQKKNKDKIPPPGWRNARYEAVLVQQHGQWLIGDLRTLAELPAPTPTPPRPSPRYIITPASASSPTPAPAPAPAPTPRR